MSDRHTAARLGALFRNMVKTSFAATGVAAAMAGCTWTFGGDDSSDFSPTDAGLRDGQVTPDAAPFDGEVPMASFDVIRCNESRYDLSDIARATGRDYVDIRQQSTKRTDIYGDAGHDAGDAPDGPIQIVGQDGTACASASNPTKCKNDLAATSPIGGMVVDTGFLGRTYEAFVANKGDEISVLGSWSTIGDFLGTIDSKTKAWLWVLARNYGITCNEPGVRAVDGDYEVIGTIYRCPNYDRILLRVTPGGTVTALRMETVVYGDTCGEGRRPEGLMAPVPSRRGGAVGRYFAHAAYLEAASISAFHTLGEELALHGAPRGLRRRAARAARDEVRHARMTSRIAKRFGADAPGAPLVARREARDLEEIALENAVEGCVRETFAALLATYKAAHAGDARIAAAMRIIAQDETRHAALAWDVAAWLDGKLSNDARARVAAAQRAAVQQVLQEAGRPVEPALERVAGHPSAREGARLAAALAASIWV